MQVSTLNAKTNTATRPAELLATVDDAREALRAVLAAILEQERNPRCVTTHGRIPPAEVWRCDDPIPSADKSLFRALTKDPMGRALRYALRRIGQVLFDLGGTTLMKKTLYEVVDAYNSPVYEALAPTSATRDGTALGPATMFGGPETVKVRSGRKKARQARHRKPG